MKANVTVILFLVFMFVMAGSESAFGQPCPPGMVGYWNSDGDASDSVGDNHGTLMPTGPTWTTGQVDGALSFDGVNDYIDVGDSDDFSFSGEFSVETWIKTTQTSVGQIVCSGNANLGGVWQVEIGRTTGKIGVYEAGVRITSNAFVNDDAWHYITVTRDSSDNLKVFIDGILDNTVASYSTTLDGTHMVIGSAAAYAVQRFNGLIDEVAIYN